MCMRPKEMRVVCSGRKNEKEKKGQRTEEKRGGRKFAETLPERIEEFSPTCDHFGCGDLPRSASELRMDWSETLKYRIIRGAVLGTERSERSERTSPLRSHELLPRAGWSLVYLILFFEDRCFPFASRLGFGNLRSPGEYGGRLRSV